MPETAWTGKTLGIIGGGNMAEALTRGVLGSGLIPAADIRVHDPLPARRDLFAGLGCQAAENPEAVLAADVVLLATKPQVLRGAVEAFAGAVRPGTLFISIAAGVPAATIEKLLPAASRLVRVMPNTPLLVSCGTSAVAKGSKADASDMRLALELFACAGLAVEVDESMLDNVTALSGSGPAYLFRLAEALIAGGTGLGMPPELAKTLAINMLKGSAEMLARQPDPALLRERVTSPGGTTAAALTVFKRRDFTGMVAEALAAAARRSVELGRDS